MQTSVFSGASTIAFSELIKQALILAIALSFGAGASLFLDGVVGPSVVGLVVWTVLLFGPRIKIDVGALVSSFLRGILIVKLSAIVVSHMHAN